MDNLITQYRSAAKGATDETNREEYRRILRKLLRIRKAHELVGNFQKPILRIEDLI